jgi:hypothetical protein
LLFDNFCLLFNILHEIICQNSEKTYSDAIILFCDLIRCVQDCNSIHTKAKRHEWIQNSFYFLFEE